MAPFSLAYRGILAARSAWWKRYARTPPLPTVSIGNLTSGGNGKTPFTLFLAQRLRQNGVRVGIVSRGYGGYRSRGHRLVSDGRYIAMKPREAGDEAVMMAKGFDGPVAVARRRINAIRLLSSNALADAVVLDDAFQHVRLRRDLDLLLINESVGLGNVWLLPAGPLREPIGAIQRADVLVMIQPFGAAQRSIDCFALDILHGKPVLRARIEPSSLVYSDQEIWREMPLIDAGRRVAAVSGIANSAQFHAMIDALGAKLIRILDYRDHYDYHAGDWKNIVAAARHAEMIITTEKDLVKLERLATREVPLYALRLKVTMEAHEESQLLRLVMQRISSVQPCRSQASRVGGGNRQWH
jgi:tetraacyldisaccharide 4'-kinase